MSEDKDTIYRDDAVKAVCKGCLKENPHCRHHWDCPMLTNLGKLPSADRPQGKWKAKSFHEYFCHNCGFSFDIMKCEFLENMKYCPNCGVPKGADDE